ncbi:MAG: TIGR02452 family protein [Firmicutes bacterium]|nr:TIGR02452 family protein [Bacillota bacterium]
MIDKKAQNIEVFNDTQLFYQTDPVLINAVDQSRKGTRLYAEDEYPDLPVVGTIEHLWLVADDPNGSLGAQGAALEAIRAIENGAPNDPVIHGQEIRMDNARTFEAAMKLRKEFPDKKIAVLNFASATRPGGGVKHGSSAQEEALCRCSTLFPTLDRRFLWQQYYDVNRAAHNALYNDVLIYSPGVVICKTDEKVPKRLPQDKFVTVDVISCAAPNLRKNPSNIYNPAAGAPVQISLQQLYEIHLSRAKHIFHIAAYNKVDILVLGAFGCGAFENDPKTVAQAWRMAQTFYRNRFDVIEYTIPKTAYDSKNYDAFHDTLWMLLGEDTK